MVPPASVPLPASFWPAAAAAWETVTVLGEPETPPVVAVTVTVADRAAPVLAAAVIVKEPGVLPLAADSVSQVWLEATV